MCSLKHFCFQFSTLFSRLDTSGTINDPAPILTACFIFSHYFAPFAFLYFDLSHTTDHPLHVSAVRHQTEAQRLALLGLQKHPLFHNWIVYVFPLCYHPFHCSYHGTNYLYREPFFSWPIDVNGVFIGFLPLVQNDPTNKQTTVHVGSFWPNDKNIIFTGFPPVGSS